jgi:hypothetical protein
LKLPNEGATKIVRSLHLCAAAAVSKLRTAFEAWVRTLSTDRRTNLEAGLTVSLAMDQLDATAAEVSAAACRTVSDTSAAPLVAAD